MRYNYLPGTSVRISLMSLGTMTFGGQTCEDESFKIMDFAYENGINFFDTADQYVDGEGERIVGKWLKGRREKIILATKVGCQMGSHPNNAGLNRRNIIAAADASLKRLQTDYLDVYYLHLPDTLTTLEETLESVSSLVKSGKVRYWGVSNYPAWQIADMLAICDKRSLTPPIVTQNVYNLITRGIEVELIPFLKAHSIGLTVFNPIAGGLLSGKHITGKPAEGTRFANNAMYHNRYWSDNNFAAVEELTAAARSFGMNILELSYKWCAAQSAVTSVICGVSKKKQIEQNLAAFLNSPEIPPQLGKLCDEVWEKLTGARFGYIRSLPSTDVPDGNINTM